MNNCFKCGLGEDKVVLYEAVSRYGIIKICRKCSFKENYPLIRKIESQIVSEPKVEQKKEILSKKGEVYQRLSRIAGYSQKSASQKSKELIDSEKQLKEISGNVMASNVLKEKPKEVVDNFHWIVMRGRRAKKLTQEQLAQKLEISETAISLVEKGLLTKDYMVLLKKLENYLGQKLIKEDFRGEYDFNKGIVPGNPDVDNLTIGELKEFSSTKNNLKEEVKKGEEDTEELSDPDLDKIIYGK